MITNLSDYIGVLNDNYILICTSNSKEKASVNAKIKNKHKLKTHINIHHSCTIGTINNRFVIHITGTSGIENKDSISRLILEYINKEKHPRPTLLLLVGFCWGNPRFVNKGDLIVSQSIISLNHKTYGEEDTEYKATKTESLLKDKITDELIARALPNARVGVIISEEALYSNTGKRDSVLAKYPNIVGGEMEAFGFVPSLSRIPWLIIKAVSDFGDSKFDRDTQSESSLTAANAIESIISNLEHSEAIKLNHSDANTLNLYDRLMGKSVTLSRENVTESNLNDYLNDEIGPIVKYKLHYYASSDSYTIKFMQITCNLILEIMQNSIKHGYSKTVTATFNQDHILIEDDGKKFDLNQLNGSHGGALAWGKFKSEFLDTDEAIYKHSNNKHKIELPKIKPELLKIINQCAANIAKNKIGSSWAQDEIIEYSPDCETIFIDAREIMMSSRAISINKEIKAIIEAGKKVIVAIEDESDAYMYDGLLFTKEKFNVIIIPKKSSYLSL